MWTVYRDHDETAGMTVVDGDGRTTPAVRREGEEANRMVHTPRSRTAFVEKDGGFTTVGVVIAVLLSVSLLFVTAQAYWVTSESAAIQDAADAGALAAANIVDEFMVIARVCDAVVLSMGLLALTFYGASAVAACIPGTEGIATPLADAAGRILEARRSFSEEVTKGLDSLQRVLPFMSMVNSAVVISANGANSRTGDSLIGLALPVPLEGDETHLSGGAVTEEQQDAIEDAEEQTAESVDDAQLYEEEMDDAKLAGYLADCGGERSMYDRASRLAGLSGLSNPWYGSVETWDFQAGIDRARAYYRARISAETLQDPGIDELANSVARRRFYSYALDVVSRGSVTVDEKGVTTADVPRLPATIVEMRDTELYTETVYPVSSDGKLHCSPLCPACAGVSAVASLSDLDEGKVGECETCRFSMTTLGNTPAATSNVATGFEYHYREFADAAERYSEASRSYADAVDDAKESTADTLGTIEEALTTFAADRYDPRPPGRYGCIAIVIDPASHDAPSALGNLTGSVTIRPRMAISAAMLATDDPEQGANIISSLLTSISDEQEASAGSRFLSKMVEVWGDLLLGYSRGYDGLMDGVDGILSDIPGLGGDDLAQWAHDELEGIIELAGLQPVKMESMKPVLVNTRHVLERSGTGLDGVLAGTRLGYDVLSADYLLATISLTDALPDYEVRVALPHGDVVDGDRGLRELIAGFGMTEEVRRWE